MTDHALIPHPSGAAQTAVRAVTGRVELVDAGTLRFEYRLKGELAQLAVPRDAPSQRAERLWEHTCFEAFVAWGTDARYCELNFSPSSEWAAYEFDGYRQGMRPLGLTRPPEVTVASAPNELRVTATAAIRELVGAPLPWRVGLTAVVEDRAGGRIYLALRHPRNDPDFHDAASFTVLLEGSAR